MAPAQGWNRNWTWVLLVAGVQAILCLVAYSDILQQPEEATLYADYDGAKNYFTPYAYLADLGNPSDHHPLKVYGQHYPFGEYVFYTDNTPALSIAGRALVRLHVLDGAHGVGLLSASIIGFQWAAAVVLFFLLLNFMEVRWLAASFSICLVWGAKQYWHQVGGSPNLSLLVFSIGLIGLMWRIYLAPLCWRWWVSAGLLIALASWFHLYYLILYGTALALFAAGLLMLAVMRPSSPQSQPWRVATSIALRAAVAGAIGILLVYVPVALIDDKLALRTGEMLGYGFDNWRIDIRSLLTPRPEYKTRFLLSHQERFFGERSVYPGLWFLYALTTLVVACLSTKAARTWIAQTVRNAQLQQFFAVLLVTGTLCFFAGLGKTYSLPGGTWTWQVFLNPFYAFVDASLTLQQFRAIARFFFITQWAWAIPVLFLLDALWRQQGWSWGPKLGVLIIVAFAALDAKDVIGARRKLHHPNPTGATVTAPYRQALDGHLRQTSYQALLVAPYYHVGSQVFELIADPASHHIQREGFTLAAASRLPMLNAISSRTPPHEAKQLLRFVAQEVVADSLAQGLDCRPILVAVHRDAAAQVQTGTPQGFHIPQGRWAREAAVQTASIASRPSATFLTQAGPYNFYQWLPPGLPACK